MVARVRHDGDGGSTYDAEMLQYVEELTSWMRQLLLILVDGYQDGRLSRMTTTSGGGGCKDLLSLGASARSATVIGVKGELVQVYDMMI